MARVGYARVSSTDQRLDVQLEKLGQCDKVFTDQQTGLTDKRPGLQSCLTYLREGDVLVVTRLDRLARSTSDLCRITDSLKAKDVAFQVLDQAIDTSTSTGRLTFHVLAAIAEFETALRAERQREGIAKAKRAGVHFGRSKALTPYEAETLRAERTRGETIRVLMRRYGIGKTALYRYLKPSKSPTVVRQAAAD